MARRRFCPIPLLATALFVLAAGAAPAQPDPLGGGVAAAATETSVLLRWSLPNERYPEGGFVVTRRGPDGTERREVPAPMPRDEALARGLVDADQYAYLASVFDAAAGGEDAALARAIARLTTVARPDYARVVGTLVEDETVEPGTTYEYEVATAGGDVLGGAEVTAGEVRPVPAVEGVRATSVEGDVTLRWQRPPEATLIAAFDVYRQQDGGDEVRLNDDPIFLPLDEGGNEPFFRDDTVTIGERYTYRVEAIDLFGRHASPSSAATVTVVDPTPLPVPAIEDAESGDLQITLHWSAPDDERVGRIGVRRYTDPEGSPTLLTPDLLPPDTEGFTDTDVEGGEDYYYALVAVDREGRVTRESPLWAQRAVNPTPPSAPQDLRVEEDADGLTVRWDAPPEDDVGHYRVYVSREGGDGMDAYRFQDVTPDPRFRQGMAQGNLAELHFRVRAVNTSDVVGPPSEPASGRLVDETPPPAPHLREVTVGDEALSVQWTAAGDPDVAGYRLYRARGDAEPELRRDDLARDDDRFVDEAVEAGVRYRYTLVAVDAAGNASDPSAPRGARLPDLARPEPVQGVTAQLEDGVVELTWSAREGLRYVVERAPGADEPFVEIAADVEAGAYGDAAGAEGDVYRVLALDADGRLGAPSEPVTAR